MNIIHTPNLPSLITDATIVVDTCIIVDTTKDKDFFAFMRKISDEYNASLISVPAVKQEVLGVADSKDEYKALEESIKALGVVFLPVAIENRYETEGMEFSIAMRRSRETNRPSFVDKLLFSVPYLYRKSAEKLLIMTSNHKDIPLDIFDRVGFIARDNGREFSQVGLYQFSQAKFSRITKNV